MSFGAGTGDGWDLEGAKTGAGYGALGAISGTDLAGGSVGEGFGWIWHRRCR